jgi:hypothetical protein
VKRILILIAVLGLFGDVWGGYSSVFPPEHTSTYVKSTANLTFYYPYLATNPNLSVINHWADGGWLSATYVPSRFHIDLGSGKVITRIYYENAHRNGSSTNAGAKDFTFWGSNVSSDFTDIVYTNNGSWEYITTTASAFEQHVALNQADPKYIEVSNVTEYRYYAFKFANNYGNTEYMGVRRIQLQITDNTPTPTETVTETVTPTITETITDTITATITETITQTITETVTPTITQTVTPTITATPTITLTATPIIKPAIHSDENNGGIWHRFRMWFNHNNLLPHNIYADFYAIKYDEVA